MIDRLSIALLLLGPACAEYVRYEAGAPIAGGGARADSLDDETKMRLAMVDHLDHLIPRAIFAEHVTTSADGDYVLFDYAALAASDEGVLLLDQYLASLDIVKAAQLRDRSERLAYWINGYNATVVRGVLTNFGGRTAYSVEENGFIFFDVPIHAFGGLLVSLNQIEHAIVRGDETHPAFEDATPEVQATFRELHQNLWEGEPVDARIHVALNCASLSCPNLLGSEPYIFRAETLDDQLDRATRAFVESAAKGAGPNGVSQIFDWYARDFEPVYGNAAGFIRQHRENGLSGVNLDQYLVYDWSLNIRR